MLEGRADLVGKYVIIFGLAIVPLLCKPVLEGVDGSALHCLLTELVPFFCDSGGEEISALRR